jgi:dipeptidyl aminopeptidase/acylaminoacyl peptidase
MNLAPQIVALDPTTKRKVQLLDLNPELGGLALGKVEVLSWKDTDGKLLSGGLYLPPNYVPGKRYPLVIQTHGFDPHGFWPDGPYTTSFAAQALANKGLVVLQVDDIFYDSLVSPKEAERVMKVYESAVSYLERRGIIDGTRVGLVGFSRTAFYVKYALTHSARRFAAAVVSDGIDAGYMQYLILANARPLTAAEFEVMIGSKPFNAGLSAWMQKSPGFGLGRVYSAVLIQALEPSSLLDEWEWFAAMKQLGRPVDLLYLPGGTHVLVKPWDRLASEQGTVDWLCFWLTGSEDLDPLKAAQYRRWRALRDSRSGLRSKEMRK